MFTNQKFVNVFQEHSALCTLNYSMVICACQGHNFRHAEAAQRAFITALKLGGIVNCSDANDQTLANHQSWHRLLRADCAGVRQTYVCALKIFKSQLIGFDFTDDVFVGQQESCKIQSVGISQNWHNQTSLTFAFVDIHGQPHIHVGKFLDLGFALFVSNVDMLHVRHRICDRPNNCVTN